MTYFSLRRILALSNMIILLILLADAFLLPATRVQEIYDRRYSTQSGNGYRSHHFSSDFIKAVSGDEVQVPSNWKRTNIGLNGGDTFYVDKSVIFNKPIRLYFPWNGGFGRMNINIFINGYGGPLLLLYIFIISALALVPHQLIRNEKAADQAVLLASFLIVVLLSLYFF